MKKILLVCLVLGIVSASLKNEEVTHRLEFTVSFDGVEKGSYELGLFGKVVPKTVENFKSLCTGKK